MIKQFSKKGAIELSMTTIIVIIIGITLLGLGLTWISGVFNKIGDLSDQAFIQADKEIRENMRADQNFYVSGQTFQIEAGESKTINVGVRNTLGAETAIVVTIVARTTENNEWIHQESKSQTLTVATNNVEAYPIVIIVPDDVVPGTTATFEIKASGNSQVIGTEIIVINVV